MNKMNESEKRCHGPLVCMMKGLSNEVEGAQYVAGLWIRSFIPNWMYVVFVK